MPTDPTRYVAVRSAVVYRFFDADRRLLYVGYTAVGPARWTAHAATQPWWPLVDTVTVAHFDSEEDAIAAELLAIQVEKPLYNVIHNVVRSVPPRRIRKRGSGSIYQRQDGRWVAQISLGWQGYGRRPTRYCSSRAEAEAALAEMLPAR